MQNFLPKNYPHTYNRAASDLSSDAAPCVHEPVYPGVRAPVHPCARASASTGCGPIRRHGGSRPSCRYRPRSALRGRAPRPPSASPAVGQPQQRPLRPQVRPHAAVTPRPAPTAKPRTRTDGKRYGRRIRIRRPSGSKASALTGISSAPAVPPPRARTSTTDIP